MKLRGASGMFLGLAVLCGQPVLYGCSDSDNGSVEEAVEEVEDEVKDAAEEVKDEVDDATN